MDIYSLAQGKRTKGIFLASGSLLFGASLGWILSPNKLAAGGIAGISVILGSFLPIGVGTLSLILNIPLLLVSCRVFGRRFLLETAAAISICALCANYFSLFPAPVTDPLLAAVFGSAVMGLGCGAVFLSGATTGGTDIAAKLILRKKPHFAAGKVFLAIDGSICLAGGIVFGSVQTALYAFIGLFVFSKVLDKKGGRAAAAAALQRKCRLYSHRCADRLLRQRCKHAYVRNEKAPPAYRPQTRCANGQRGVHARH